MNKNIITCLAGSAVGVFCAGTALAQGVAEYEGLDSGITTKFTATAGFGYRTESDVDHGGKSSMTSMRIASGTALNLNEKVGFNFLGSYTFNHYDFQNVARDPWDNIHSMRLAPLFEYRFDETWSAFGGPTIAFAAEDGADFGDSITGGGIVGFRYRASERLTLGLGVAVLSQIEDDAKIVPVPIVNWRFADDWTLKVGFDEVAANGGLGGEVIYTLNPQWQFAGGVQFQKRRFRLDDNGPAKDGVGQDRSTSIYLKTDWQITRQWAVEGLIGVSAGGQYRIENKHGNKLGETDYDGSALLGLRGVFTF